MRYAVRTVGPAGLVRYLTPDLIEDDREGNAKTFAMEDEAWAFAESHRERCRGQSVLIDVIDFDWEPA